MDKNKKNSIEKLDEQIEKLISNENDDTNTPFLSKKELNRKIKLEKLDEEIEKNKNKKKNTSISSITTKTIDLDGIKDKIKSTSSKPVKKTSHPVKKKNSSKKKSAKSKKITDKVINKVESAKNNLKIKSLDKKKLIDEVLDNESEVDKLIKLLTKIFSILIGIMIVWFIIICII